MIETVWLVVWAAFVCGVIVGFILCAIFAASDTRIKKVPSSDESLPPASVERGRHGA